MQSACARGCCMDPGERVCVSSTLKPPMCFVQLQAAPALCGSKPGYTLLAATSTSRSEVPIQGKCRYYQL